jgi:hypothetical protein
MSSHLTVKGGVDMTLKAGDLVWVPCAMQAGPFPDELAVSVETRDGVISGFVKRSNLKIDPADASRGHIKGAIVEATDDSTTVKLYGSFFTTAQGVASVGRHSLARYAA